MITAILLASALLAPASQQPTAACKAYAESGNAAGNINTSMFSCRYLPRRKTKTTSKK